MQHSEEVDQKKQTQKDLHMSTILELPKELDLKLEQIATSEKKPKFAIIQESLDMYIRQKVNFKSPFELGKKLFGRNGSGKGDLSVNAESILRKRLNAKMHS